MKNETCLKPSSLMKIKMKYINKMLFTYSLIYSRVSDSLTHHDELGRKSEASMMACTVIQHWEAQAGVWQDQGEPELCDRDGVCSNMNKTASAITLAIKRFTYKAMLFS